jgi:hypothetical protein
MRGGNIIPRCRQNYKILVRTGECGPAICDEGRKYHPDRTTLLQDGMLNSTPQQGCIWTKVFLARKVFLASGQGQYMLKNGFFQP